MEAYHPLRRKEKEIGNAAELKAILAKTEHVTLAMCRDSEPYLVTLSHGYDEKRNVIYFHCAAAGKKIDFLKANRRVWGQALVDNGYAHGQCSHNFCTVQFDGRVTFVSDPAEKRHALGVMIRQLEREPEKVAAEQITDVSVERVCIGRIDIDFLSGKRSPKAVGSL